MHGCYRQSAKRKGRKNKRGRLRALWNILEFGGSGREKKSKCTCVEEKKRGEKKENKRRKCGTCVEEKKRGEKKEKKKEMLSQYFHNTFTINFKRKVIIC